MSTHGAAPGAGVWTNPIDGSEMVVVPAGPFGMGMSPAELDKALVFSAASAEPDAAAVVTEGMRRHDQGASQATRRLAALDALAPGMTAEQAAAVFAMMTSPASWQQLTQRSGWSFDEAETWLTASLTQLLLDTSR